MGRCGFDLCTSEAAKDQISRRFHFVLVAGIDQLFFRSAHLCNVSTSISIIFSMGRNEKATDLSKSCNLTLFYLFQRHDGEADERTIEGIQDNIVLVSKNIKLAIFFQPQ